MSSLSRGVACSNDGVGASLDDIRATTPALVCNRCKKPVDTLHMQYLGWGQYRLIEALCYRHSVELFVGCDSDPLHKGCNTHYSPPRSN